VNRWVRLAAAVVAMAMISNLQYCWTLFVQPIMTATGWKLSQVQTGFSIFIAVVTWAMPLAGWLIDRIGPRVFLSIAGVLCAVGWASLGHATSLTEFYLIYAVAGLGVSFVYCSSIGAALKWFPDKRGLASGIIAGAYGSGAALFILVFSKMIRINGYRSTFVTTGILIGVVIFIAGQFLAYPPAGFASTLKIPVKAKVRKQGTEDFNSLEMLRKPHFYLMYVMMLMVGIGGLMTSAQVAPVAKTFKIGSTALALTLTLGPIGNGLGRFFWGWISDYMGRERTMITAFVLQSVFLVSVVTLGPRGDFWFVASMFMVFATWGEVYVLFAATQADMFGAKNAASNYSFLYNTKGIAALLAGGIAAVVFERTGSWSYVYYPAALLALIAAIGAIALKKIPSPKKAPLLETAANSPAQGFTASHAGD
jgi:OFA family oxalate/formate antiporter-like MFS transporter